MTFTAAVMAAGLEPRAAAAASFTTLFEFPGGSNGSDPVAAVTQGPDGALYGTTQGGGGGLCAGTCGTIFKLTPPHRTGAGWSWKLLNSFEGSNVGGGGGFPEGGPAFGTDGSLYVVQNVVQTVAGRSSCGFCGDAYKLTRTGRPGEPWTITNIYEFGTGIDAAHPWNPLVKGADGAFYGLSQQGGDPNCLPGGCGALFKLTPPATPGGTWQESVVYRETLAGSLPNPGLTQFGGAFYYTSNSGQTACGSLSRIAPKPGGGWRNEVLFAFPCSGQFPFPSYGVLVERGKIFGTVDGTSGGWVFALTPPPGPGARWNMKILHKFAKPGTTDGSLPTGAVVAGAHGVIFGATALGGSQNCGTVWQLTPPAAADGPWTEKILHDFQNGADGCFPASISPGMNGVLYGTTQGERNGGAPNGTVFEIVP
jgi:uncharacterized repeat protein (TIGR03803 family)